MGSDNRKTDEEQPIITNQILCGEVSPRSGKECRIPLRGGKCMTHNPKLKKRNRKVARAFKRKDPDGFKKQRSQAGKQGFKRAVAAHGYEFIDSKARWYRQHHPSEPERWMIGLLKELNAPAYEREYDVGKRCSADFAWPATNHRAIIEVNGHQSKPSFGEKTSRLDRQMKKIERLQDEGWLVLIVNTLGDREACAVQVRDFLEQTGVLGSSPVTPNTEPEPDEFYVALVRQ